MVSTLSDQDRAVQQCFPALLSKIAALFLVIVTQGEAQRSPKKNSTVLSEENTGNQDCRPDHGGRRC
jgi:hypothetical protein